MRAGAAVAFHDHAPKLDSFRDAVLNGLSRPQKRIPCRFLYDERGSDLFEAICETPEYYPTRTEIRILQESAAEIAKLIGPDATLIEYGSGAGQKVKLLLRALDRPRAYAGIEVSREILLRATDDLAVDLPNLQVVAICADFLTPIALPPALQRAGGRRVAFFPGSSIGNFTPAEATQFLARCRAMIGPGGGMLVGVDLKKDEARLDAAYNDATGVTADFTLNLLERMNRELDADFVVERFRPSCQVRSGDGPRRDPYSQSGGPGRDGCGPPLPVRQRRRNSYRGFLEIRGIGLPNAGARRRLHPGCVLDRFRRPVQRPLSRRLRAENGPFCGVNRS